MKNDASGPGASGGNSEHAWVARYIAPLKGRKIVGTSVSKDGFPQLTLDDGKVLEISCDGEGNGPGFIFGLDKVK